MSSIYSIRFSRRTLSVAAFLFLAEGCASTAKQLDLPTVAELIEVPFYAQTAYDCGPAALAMILNDADIAVAPAELIDMVYIEGLRGSLQAELLAATRRFGLLPVPVAPTPESLLGEVGSGRPVLVLQNLGLKRAPVWHYAVVVGFDAGEDEVILRSGQERRRTERTARFLRHWRLADSWGFVAVQPGDIPASTTAATYMRALIGSQRQLGESSAAAAYDAALSQWPDDSSVLFFVATHRHAASQWSDAAKLYRDVLTLEPGHAAARNNLANVLLEQGCRDEARHEAQRAFQQQSQDGEFYSAIVDTLRRIEGAPDADQASTACATG